MNDERRAEIEAGLAEEVAWAINYLRGIQGEINELHREGRLKLWDRSRLHDLIRCVVDGVQGRVGLERALRGEVSTTAERSAFDRVRDARDDDEAVEVILNRIIDAASLAGADGVLPAETVRVECLRATYALGAARSPQGEAHEESIVRYECPDEPGCALGDLDWCHKHGRRVKRRYVSAPSRAGS